MQHKRLLEMADGQEFQPQFATDSYLIVVVGGPKKLEYSQIEALPTSPNSMRDLRKLSSRIRKLSHNVNVGIVGTGLIQDSFHMPTYAEIEEARVVAVAGTTQEKASASAKKWVPVSS